MLFGKAAWWLPGWLDSPQCGLPAGRGRLGQRSARRGAGRQAQMGEDFDNHRRIFDRGDDLQAAAAVRAVLDVDIEQ